MKIDHRTHLWRGRNGHLWRLADRLEDTAQAIRYADKPHDLVFPITNLCQLVGQLREMQWEWLAEKLGLDKKARNRWPNL